MPLLPCPVALLAVLGLYMAGPQIMMAVRFYLSTGSQQSKDSRTIFDISRVDLKDRSGGRRADKSVCTIRRSWNIGFTGRRMESDIPVSSVVNIDL